MTYWHDIMHDDVFLIMNEGWVDAAKPRKTIEDKDRKLSEDARPRRRLRAQRHQVQDGPHPAGAHRRALLRRRAGQASTSSTPRPRKPPAPSRSTSKSTPSRTDCSPRRWTTTRSRKALATARLKDAKREGSDPDEIKALQHLIELYDAEAAAKKAVKEAQAALDLATLKKYGDLTEADVKALVLDDKWHATVASRVAGEVNALTLALVARIQRARRALRRDGRRPRRRAGEARSQGCRAPC